MLVPLIGPSLGGRKLDSRGPIDVLNSKCSRFCSDSSLKAFSLFLVPFPLLPNTAPLCWPATFELSPLLLRGSLVAPSGCILLLMLPHSGRALLGLIKEFFLGEVLGWAHYPKPAKPAVDVVSTLVAAPFLHLRIVLPPGLGPGGRWHPGGHRWVLD